MIAFVHAEESTGRNAIPLAYALRFKKKYGLTLSDVVQTNKPGHTGTDRIGRLLRRARFDGEVEEGREYILLDDAWTMGGTLRDLKDYIESKGGKVVALTALSCSRYGTSIRPTEEQIKELTHKGITNEQLKQLGIADGFAGLTTGEAEQILILAKPRRNQGSSRRRQTENGGNTGVDGGRRKEGEQSQVEKKDPGFYTPDNLKELKHEQLREFGIADNTEGLTRSEARQIILLANTRGNSSTSRRFPANDRETQGTETQTPRERAAGQVTANASAKGEAYLSSNERGGEGLSETDDGASRFIPPMI